MKKLLLVFPIAALIAVVIFLLPEDKPPIDQPTPVAPKTQSTYIPPPIKETSLDELFADINKERTTRGLGALAISNALNSSSHDKCMDMVALDYWAHDRPDGTQPWVFIKRYTTYIHAGENLAMGYMGAEAFTQAWMTSPEHKANILNPNFHKVGYSLCDFRNVKLVVQHFTN